MASHLCVHRTSEEAFVDWKMRTAHPSCRLTLLRYLI